MHGWVIRMGARTVTDSLELGLMLWLTWIRGIRKQSQVRVQVRLRWRSESSPDFWLAMTCFEAANCCSASASMLVCTYTRNAAYDRAVEIVRDHAWHFHGLQFS